MRGLMPRTIRLGTGSGAYAAVARAIIGGLLVSVVVRVYLVPAAYVIVHRKSEARLGRGALVIRAVLILTLLLEFAGNSAFAQNPNAPVGSAPGQAAQAGTPLTLQQAEAMTLRSNPQITIGK